MTDTAPTERVTRSWGPHETTHRWRARDIGYFFGMWVALILVVPGLVNGLPFRGESADAFRALAATVSVELLLVGFVFVLVRLVYGLGFWDEMRWSHDYSVNNGTLIVLGMGLSFSVMGVASLFPPTSPPIERLLNTPEAIAIFAVFGIAFAPFLEELMFRGFLFRVLEELASGSIAVRVTAVVFALVHVPQLWGSWAGMLVIFAVGYLLSVLRQRTGSLIPSVIVHTAYNGMLFVAFALSTLVQEQV